MRMKVSKRVRRGNPGTKYQVVEVAARRVMHTPCLWPFSAVLSYAMSDPDSSISAVLTTRLASLPMEPFASR
jgi:hypothetical protein